MKIPVYDDQVSLNPAAPQTQKLPAPLASASPSSVHEANARLGSVVTDIGEKLMAHAIEFQKEQNETELFKQDNALGDKIATTLTDPDKGILTTLKLGKAATATTSFNDFSKATLDGIDAMEVSDAIKRPLRERAMTRLATAKSAVVTHQQQQLEEDHKISFNANIDNQKRALSYAPNPKAFLDGRTMIHATIEPEISRMGFVVGTPEYDNVKAKLFAAADEDSLKSYLGDKIESNPSAALTVLAQFKGSVDAGAYSKLVNEAQKNAFASTVLSSKMAGMGKDEILAKYVATEKNPDLQADRAEMVDRAFATRNYALYNSAWERVQKNTITTAEIDQMERTGQLPVNDAISLRKDLMSARGGESLPPEMKIALDNLELKATETWGKDKEKGGEATKVELFKYVIKQEAKKISDPAALYKRGLDLMKDTTIPTAHWWTNDDYPAYKVELEKGRAEALADASSWENAGASLLKHGELDTPANRKAVISTYKDGNY